MSNMEKSYTLTPKNSIVMFRVNVFSDICLDYMSFDIFPMIDDYIAMTNILF